VCGHDDFIVKIPNSIGNVSLEEGKEVNIGWMSDDCLALDG
jgi:putative spermidine/putrescine transport system ATP-binding protein